jgi:hypothetical protein
MRRPRPKNALICRRQGPSWIARRWHLYPQLHAARGPSSWRRNRSPVTVPRASGENPGQDDPDAAGVLDLDSGPEMGTSPGSSNGPEPGRRPCPGTPWRSRPPRPRPPGRRRIRLPGASILYLGITLSDERGEGERAHCRRSGVRHERERRRVLSLITGSSARMFPGGEPWQAGRDLAPGPAAPGAGHGLAGWAIGRGPAGGMMR